MPDTERSLACPNVEWGALAGELLRLGRRVRLRVRGQSMHPAIRDGDVLHLVAASTGPIHPGDVVLYMNGDIPIVHRVIHRQWQNGTLYFCIDSDRSTAGMDCVQAAQVLGRAVAIERGGRYIPLDGWRGRLWGWGFLALRPFRPLIRWLRRFGKTAGLLPAP